ncbi:unnamed protein product, partial [Prorocentrum cordatum]
GSALRVADGSYQLAGCRPLARIADIAAEYPSHDAIVLGGTQLSNTGELVEPERIMDSFRCYQFGYNRGPPVTPSCGISILLKKSRFPNHAVNERCQYPSSCGEEQYVY